MAAGKRMARPLLFQQRVNPLLIGTGRVTGRAEQRDGGKGNRRHQQTAPKPRIPLPQKEKKQQWVNCITKRSQCLIHPRQRGDSPGMAPQRRYELFITFRCHDFCSATRSTVSVPPHLAQQNSSGCSTKRERRARGISLRIRRSVPNNAPPVYSPPPAVPDCPYGRWHSHTHSSMRSAYCCQRFLWFWQP